MRIGLHRIKHVAGKAVEKLLGGGGEFFGMHQIERLARLQALDRLLRRWQSAAACRNGRERSSAVILRLWPRLAATRGTLGRQKGRPQGRTFSCGAPFGAPVAALMTVPCYCGGARRRRRSPHSGRGPSRRPIMRRMAHHAPCPSCHALAIMRAARRKRSCFCVGSVRHRALSAGRSASMIGQAPLQHVFLAVERSTIRAAGRQRAPAHLPAAVALMPLGDVEA